uniref:AlNc14C22G2308 protein n=1 Tax=Albugo laibachii Nc14 TaxID=890382 RepID=F0W603_9STRA|nr:AlNc14C22G2308 [Albugo laibachii Nc14]|eukprot:CCA16545.1 AlNc14C22G2308 [Albugo laibachii Nc14]
MWKHKYVRSPYQWSTVVYWTALDLTADACKHYGTHNIIRVLNVIRCVVLRSLWTERNTAIFRPHLLQSRTDTISTSLSASKSAAHNIHSHLKMLGTIATRNDSLQGLCTQYINDSKPVPSPLNTLSPLPHIRSTSADNVNIRLAFFSSEDRVRLLPLCRGKSAKR